jgi:hypothetical protein
MPGEPASGGYGSPENVQAEQLAQRTQWLRQKAAELESAIPGTGEFQELLAAIQAEMDRLSQISVGSLRRELDHIQDTVAGIIFELEGAGIYPDYTHMILENFAPADQIDMFACGVLSVVAGDNSIDVDSLGGMVSGSRYTLTDGLNSEPVRVESMSAENGVNRVILESAVQNTYRLENARLWRTSAEVGDGYAQGPTGQRAETWSTALWQGQAADVEADVPLGANAGNLSQFAASGDISVTADGLVTLG